jgi:amidohydrolase
VSGAKPMVAEGCLDGVNEVYGFHNWPSHPVGYLLVKPGPMMSEVTIINLKLIGRGGHASEPEKSVDPIQVGVDFHVKFRELKESPKFKNRKFVSTLPVFQVGERYNVIASTGTIQGTLRSFEEGLTFEFKQEFINILEGLKEKYPLFTYELDWNATYPIVWNSETETKHVERLARE